jgi:outer membrane protein insertion porin family
MNASETDITSLYMNDGHLFFQVTPVERIVGKDSVDIEMRIYEGKQAIINRVTIVGNDKTNDQVIMREIRTRPGQLFRRSDIVRTQRELSQLGYFDPEKMGVTPVPNPQDGTVDIEYRVEEKPSDQLQLSGGWGAGRLIGNLGLAFNNFIAKKFFKKGAWTTIPSGDGQRLSINASSTGRAFQSYNLSFTEPWLGGRKPNSLTVTGFHSVFGNGAAKDDPSRSVTKTTGLVVGFGRRLRWPDDFFTLQHSINYSYYELANSSAFGSFTNGFANNLSFSTTFSRNSVDQPIYPASGSTISLSVQLTPPYSIINNNTAADFVTDQQRYKWIEFHKWKFDAQWFTPLSKNNKPEFLFGLPIGNILPIWLTYTNNISSNPMFVNEAQHNYKLSDYSPAIGFGAAINTINTFNYSAPITDIEGNLRPNPAGSNPDLGVYELDIGDVPLRLSWR